LAFVRLEREGIEYRKLSIAVFFDKLNQLDRCPPIRIIPASADMMAEMRADEALRELSIEELAPDFVDPFEGLED